MTEEPSTTTDVETTDEETDDEVTTDVETDDEVTTDVETDDEVTTDVETDNEETDNEEADDEETIGERTTDEESTAGETTTDDGHYEVEVKVRADHELVRERLADRGARPVGAVRQRDTYYDAPDRDFAETDEALRIRRETHLGEGGRASDDTGRAASDDAERAASTTAKLTYKGPLVEAASKTRAEHETAVEDATALEGVLDGLGYEPAATVEKRRERFELDGYTVTLDDVTGLETFVEVEREATEAEIETVREGARALLSELGLDPAEQIRTSYLGLVRAERE